MEREIEKNRLCQSIILALTTLVAAMSWYGLRGVLEVNLSWVWVIASFYLLVILLVLGWLMTNSKIILIINHWLILISFFFSFGFRWEYLLAILVVFLIFWLAALRVLNQKKLLIKLRLDKIIKAGLPLFLTGLILIISTAYFFSPLLVKNQGQIKIPRPLFNFLIDPLLGLTTKQAALNQFFSQFELTTDNQQFKENLYQLINQQINRYAQSPGEYLSLGLAISLFIFLKIASIPFLWLVILTSWLIFKGLIRWKVVEIEERAVLKEEIRL